MQLGATHAKTQHNYFHMLECPHIPWHIYNWYKPAWIYGRPNRILGGSPHRHLWTQNLILEHGWYLLKIFYRRLRSKEVCSSCPAFSSGNLSLWVKSFGDKMPILEIEFHPQFVSVSVIKSKCMPGAALLTLEQTLQQRMNGFLNCAHWTVISIFSRGENSIQLKQAWKQTSEGGKFLREQVLHPTALPHSPPSRLQPAITNIARITNIIPFHLGIDHWVNL